MVNKSADISLRAQVLTLSYCTPASIEFIAATTGYSVPNIYRIRRISRDRGFDPAISLQVLDKYARHEEKSGRPRKATTEKEDEVIDLVIKDRYAREKTSAQLAREVGLSRCTVWRILKQRGYKKVKPSYRPGLTPEMKAARLAFCLLYKDWTVEDWKRVIWSDETAIVLGHRRGAVKIWRTTKEEDQSNPPYVLGGMGLMNSCFGDAFPTIGRGHVIAGNRRQKRKKRKPKPSLTR